MFNINEQCSNATRTNKNDHANANENFCIEKIFCYELPNYFYIIGSSSCKSKNRVLKIDRRNKNVLNIENIDKVFTSQDLIEYRKQEDFASSKRIEPIVGFGIVGFVRFLEGYYMILISKRRCIALLGMHCIYKIEDTKMIYIPNEEKTAVNEQKYLKIFNNVDLKSNFYFSYSYDLSNTLQYNLSPICNCDDTSFRFGFGTPNTIWDGNEKLRSNRNCTPIDDDSIYFKPNMTFVWNEYLLMPMHKVNANFFLYICHGFVSQAMLPIDGRTFILTLIARRSKKYAGTRFLKRGVNCEGYSANEVETEQIIHDGNISSFRYGLFSSFVQIRGSVPIYWSQNISKMTTKPPINIDVFDPFYEAAGKHFNNLFYNYGSPIIVLNLVKKKEKRPRESILFKQFEYSIEYLNQFLPKQHHIIMIGYDMAKSKKQGDNVISCLTNIAQYTLKRTGFYQNRCFGTKKMVQMEKFHIDNGSIIQTGLVRVNCVDCLDRTNTAQCVIGIVALAYQLYSMGVLPKPELDSDSDIVRLFEEIYEDHGDTLALQYGGSQLVHRIKTYRKNAPITSQSKDIMQSLSRYYSNAFSDWEKQAAINLFLGIFEAWKSSDFLWTINSDYELHHKFFEENFQWKKIDDTGLALQNKIRFTKWWSDQVALCLPRAFKEFFKYTIHSSLERDSIFMKMIKFYDWFADVHRVQENTIFVEMFLFNMKKSKHLIDYSKKIIISKTNKNLSLKNIPVTLRGSEDSESSEDSDGEEGKIIVRFQNDSESILLKDSESETNENNEEIGSNSNINHSNHNKRTKIIEDYLNKKLCNNRNEYERLLRNLYATNRIRDMNRKSIITFSTQYFYQQYLHYTERFSHLYEPANKNSRKKNCKSVYTSYLFQSN